MREVKSSGRLEDKDFTAVALLCSGLVARLDIFVVCARYNRRNKSGRLNFNTGPKDQS